MYGGSGSTSHPLINSRRFASSEKSFNLIAQRDEVQLKQQSLWHRCILCKGVERV